jgi:hypothetical protein
MAPPQTRAKLWLSAPTRKPQPKRTTGPKQKTKSSCEAQHQPQSPFRKGRSRKNNRDRKGGTNWNKDSWSYCLRELPIKEKDQECQSTKLGQGKQLIHHQEF